MWPTSKSNCANALLSALITALFVVCPLPNQAATADIQSQLQAKQQKIQELKQQIQSLQNAIVQKQSQAVSLKQQLAVVEDRIAKAELDISANDLSLNSTTLKIQQTSTAIGEREQQLARQRAQVAETLRQLRRTDQQDLVEVLAANSTLGDFYEQMGQVESLERSLQNSINAVHVVKRDLEHYQQDLVSYKSELLSTREELERSKNTLAVEQDSKQNLLKETRQSENRYQSLLQQTIAEQQKASRDIQNLENQARQRLSHLGQQASDRLGDTNFIWPVSPTKGVSTYFHDPTYIFRRYFEHPAIDIPRPQGSDIKAAADGYVGQAKDAGLGYSYIMLIHRYGFATVYGHVSRINVELGQFVSKGQVIAGVGGIPGTRGAGPLTTGAHLHFEIRLSGIPMNPLDYLP